MSFHTESNHSVRSLLFAVVLSLTALLAGCAGQGTQTTEPERSTVTVSDLFTMGDAELADSLVTSGYESEADGSGTTYRNDKFEVYIDGVDGYRVVYVDGDSNMYDFLSESGAPFGSLSEYGHDAVGPFVVGVCPVDGSDGLVIAADGTIMECLPGSMHQVQNISPKIPVDSNMTAGEAAEVFADDIVGQGYYLLRGDKIDSRGDLEEASDETSSSSSSAESEIASSAHKETISPSDIKIENVVLEADPDVGLAYGRERYGYFVTGTVTNESDIDVAYIGLNLNAEEHDVDSYGDDTEKEVGCTITSTMAGALRGGIISNLKAGETREFRFATVRDKELSNPRFDIRDVYTYSEWWGKEFSADEITATIEQDEERHFAVTVKNATGKTLKNATVYFAARYGSEEGGEWEERTIEIEKGRLRPDVETRAVNSEFNDWVTDIVYLGTEYYVDSDYESVGLSDEFSYEIAEGEDGRILRLTNNTGHYLSKVSVWHSWWQLPHYPQNEGWYSSVDSYSGLKPGETYDVPLEGPAGDAQDAVINDIMYEIDEDKESSLS